jgi:hypothetical protein
MRAALHEPVRLQTSLGPQPPTSQLVANRFNQWPRVGQQHRNASSEDAFWSC